MTEAPTGRAPPTAARISMGVDIAGDGAVLLLVHGFPLDRSMWRSVTARLSGCCTIAPDLSGFGATPPMLHRCSMEACADDLAALLEAYGAESAVVCGLSMEDQLVPVEEARAMAAAIPGARFFIVPQAGHLAPLEQPARVAEEMAAFLAACG